jgi:hypothetical protein
LKILSISSRLVRGREIQGPPRQLLQSIVFRRVEFNHRHPFLDHPDERNEQIAIEAIFVEFIGHRVRGRHDDDALLEHSLEKPPEDHRIGDVRYVQLVETQQPAFLRDIARHRRNGITWNRLARGGDALVHLAHELVEMYPPLRPERDMLEEHVHQHGLAAADLAMDVDPARRLSAGATAQDAKEPPLGQPPVRETRCQVIETRRHLGLRRIALETVPPGPCFIMCRDRLRHADRSILKLLSLGHLRPRGPRPGPGSVSRRGTQTPSTRRTSAPGHGPAARPAPYTLF